MTTTRRRPDDGSTADAAPATPSAHRVTSARVSVVMCVYQADRPGPVLDAVTSVLRQTYADLVLRILVNGPVSAEVQGVLDGLRDPRIRIGSSETNLGLAMGLNRLIDESVHDGCDVVARMDADDISYLDRLEKQLAYLQQHPEVAVLGAGCLEFDEDTGAEFLKLLPVDDRTLKRNLVKRTPFVHPVVVFRSEIFARGIRYRRDPTEDIHLWIDLARYGWTFANLPEPLLRYRVSQALFRRRTTWSRAAGEVRARARAMNELCMISLGNVVWTGAYFVLRLLPVSLARGAYQYLRPRRPRA